MVGDEYKTKSNTILPRKQHSNLPKMADIWLLSVGSCLTALDLYELFNTCEAKLMRLGLRDAPSNLHSL